jgi:hypothetical protein
MYSTVFNESDALKFAEFSGDWNPLHTDREVAEKTICGAPLVHGMDLVIYALSHLYPKNDNAILDSLFVEYKSPVRWGDEIDIEMDDGLVRVNTEGTQAITIFPKKYGFNLQHKFSDPDFVLPNQLVYKYALEDIRKMVDDAYTGLVITPVSKRAYQFFAPEGTIAPYVITDLLNVSRIVGTRCPGYRSLCLAIALHRRKDPGQPGMMHYHPFELKGRELYLHVEGTTLVGNVRVLVRPD